MSQDERLQRLQGILERFKGDPVRTASIQRLIDYLKIHRTSILESCGASGFRVTSLDGRVSKSVAGAHRTLQAAMWSAKAIRGGRPARAPFKKSRPQRHRKDNEIGEAWGQLGEPPLPMPRGRSSTVRFDTGKSYFGHAAGLKRGSAVHREVGRFVTWESERFNASYPKVDPMTKGVLLQLCKLNFVGVDAEFPVFDTDLGVGTMIDLVCLNATGELVFVELKTGYDNAFTESQSRMRRPFTHLEDSALNRARTQILLAMALFESHTPRPSARLDPIHGHVIQVDRCDRVISFGMGPFQDSLVGRHGRQRLFTDLREAIRSRPPRARQRSNRGRPPSSVRRTSLPLCSVHLIISSPLPYRG
jgi:hypothetical protein